MPRFVFPQIIPEFLVFRQSLVQMEQLLLRGTLTLFLYGIWVTWLWRLDHVFMIDDNPAIGEAIGLLLSGLGLLVWIVWSLAHWK
ncbi:hypothetical protein DIS16_12045 [Levilactobacillus brevis]|nr:hypothetical protein DIS16_12045 [Levilactobacillus brevis]